MAGEGSGRGSYWNVHERICEEDTAGRVGRRAEVHAAKGGDSAQRNPAISAGEDTAGDSGDFSRRSAARLHGVWQYELSASSGARGNMGSSTSERDFHGDWG